MYMGGLSPWPQYLLLGTYKLFILFILPWTVRLPSQDLLQQHPDAP